MNLNAGGSVNLRAPENGETWCVDLGIVAAEGERPSAAVYLDDDECRRLARWMRDMTGQRLIDALDLPSELTDLQDAYWNARRKWKALEAAYQLVLADMLSREGSA